MPFKPHPTDPNSVIYSTGEFVVPKPWVGMTDDAEIFALSSTMPYANRFEFARAIEQLLKEKNS